MAVTVAFRRICFYLLIFYSIANARAEITNNKQYFAVRLTHHQQLHQGQILKFDSIVTNVGDGYNPHTGIFTCHHSGPYQFTATIMSANPDGNALEMRMRIEGKAIANFFISRLYQSRSGSVIVDCNIGDHVYMQSSTTELRTVQGNYHTVFGGNSL